MRLKLLYIMCCLCALPTWGVEIVSRRLNSASGLPDNNVRSILQDNQGYIWMGTPGGLYRFDGYMFTTFKYSSEGSNRLLNNNHITGLLNAGNDRILIAEQGGQLSVYDTRRNTFLEMEDAEKRQLYTSIKKAKVSNKLLDKYRHIISNGGNVINDNLGNAVVLDNTGMIWYIDSQTGETIPMKVYDTELFPLVSSKKYKVLTSVKKGLIWVSTNGCGITVYDLKNRCEQHIRQESGLVSTDYIVDMCLDQDDNIWVAEEFHGVTYLSTVQNQPEVRMLAPNARSLRSNQVYIMQNMPDSTVLIANTLGDVYKADRRLNIDKTPTYKGVDIHTVCVDKEGRTWIGTRQRGLMTGQREWYRHEPSDQHSLSSDNIYHLLCDKAGRIWVACENTYLDLAVRQQNGIYTFRHFFGNDFSARVMFEGKDGVIWVGTKNGLYAFRPEELLRDSTAYIHPLTGADLNYSDVSSIYQDAQGTLWIGTLGNGLYTADAKSQTFTRRNNLNLLSNDIQSIMEDKNGMLWFATKNGLTTYDPQTGKTWQHYSESNLLHNYYVDNCVCRLNDGRIAFGTNSGILIYDTEKITGSNRRNNRLSVTQLLVNGEPLNFSDKVTLEYDENSLTIHFSALNYHDQTGIRYSYMLEGYDNKWSEPSPYSFTSYKNLPPGAYVLHLKAYEPGQSEQETSLPIVIKYPWWKTWWASLIWLFSLIVVCYMVYRQLSIIYKLRRRIDIETRLTEYKLQFFTNISHEFRTPLTIIRGAIERIKSLPVIPADMRQPVSNMDKSVSRMLRLVNQLLEFRKMQNDKLKLALEEVDIVKTLRDFYQSFRDIADNKHINYMFFTQEKSRQMFVDMEHLDKIVFNILSNAFKYTPAGGEIRMCLTFPDDKVQIRVEDSGVGIPEDRQPELFQRFMQSSFSNNSIGIGLHLTKGLVEVHHGRIWYEPNSPKGSVFVVELPATTTMYSQDDFLASEHKLLDVKKVETLPNYREMEGQPMNDREILIVEDDSDVLDYLCGILQHYFVVHTAMDGVEALQVLETLHPDLIVSDIMMPLMDGLELTSHIRSQDEIKDTPIILLTALTGDEKRIKAVEKGADAYITKPFEPVLLIKTAVNLISQRDMLKGRYAQIVESGAKAELPELIVEERDKKLLNAIEHWLTNHISDPTLSVDALAEAMGYGRTVFYRKMKVLTGQTPADYIKTLRMNQAAEMLKSENITVAEVCYKVGISDPHYFAKVFKQQFGVSPKKYQQHGSE